MPENPVCVPAQPTVFSDHLIWEPVYFLHMDFAVLHPAEHVPAAGRANVDRKMVLHMSAPPLEKLPFCPLLYPHFGHKFKDAFCLKKRPHLQWRSYAPARIHARLFLWRWLGVIPFFRINWLVEP